MVGVAGPGPAIPASRTQVVDGKPNNNNDVCLRLPPYRRLFTGLIKGANCGSHYLGGDALRPARRELSCLRSTCVDQAVAAR